MSWGARSKHTPLVASVTVSASGTLLLSMIAVFRICNPRFPPQVTVGYGVSHGNIKQTRTICISVLPACAHMTYTWLVSTESRRGHQSPWYWMTVNHVDSGN